MDGAAHTSMMYPPGGVCDAWTFRNRNCQMEPAV